MYNEVCRKLVVDFLNGFNACVMGYGQTGSGKTYTLFGPGGMGDRLSTRGLVPRACEEVLEAIAQRQTRGVESDMACSYVEIYGDTISDLLKNGARCGQNKVQYYPKKDMNRNILSEEDNRLIRTILIYSNLKSLAYIHMPAGVRTALRAGWCGRNAPSDDGGCEPCTGARRRPEEARRYGHE